MVLASCEPWSVLAAILAATTGERLGYSTRVAVIEADAAALVAARVCVPGLIEAMDAERVEIFAGPDGLNDFERVWNERLGTTLPVSVISARDDVRQRVSETLERLHARQRSEFAERRDSVQMTAVPTRRVRTALIFTSRFTTYVKHSVEGLASAMERAGIRTRVLMEPDRFSTLSGVAYLREVMEHPPDVVIGSNFTRGWLKEMIPPDVPFVGWIQDAIPRLFDRANALAQGPRDVLVGYVFSELADQHGYDLARMHYSGIPVDGHRFHDGPVGRAERTRFGCDLAMVSHHSEPPETMAARLISEIGADAGVRRMLGSLVPAISDAIANANTDWPFSRLRKAVREAAPGAPDTAVTALVRQFALPLADRMLRHQSLAWAAELAADRGLKLHLYGSGWEKHPTLASFARGPLAHGEELRAAYQCAQLNLHVSLTTLVHQRVSECALSGGLCVARYHRDAISGPRTTAMLKLIESPPDVVDEANGRIGYVVADHPAAMRQHLLFSRLGEPTDGPVLWVNAARADKARTHRRLIDHDMDADQLFGDLALLTYQSKPGLERLVERSQQADWRAGHQRRIAAYAAAHLSFEVLAARMLDAVRDPLSAADAGGPLTFPVSTRMLAERVA